MININLLEQGSGRKRRSSGAMAGNPSRPSSSGTPVGSYLVTFVALVMLSLIGSLGWKAYDKVHASGDDYREIQSQIDGFNKTIEENKEKSQQVREYRKVIENQLDVLNSLDPPHRILWCEKINMLASLVPDDVFISEVSVVEKVNMVETRQSKQAREEWVKADKKTRGKEPQKVMKPVIRYNFQVIGLALGQDNVEQFDNVLQFQKAVADYQVVDAQGVARRFMDGFEPDIDFKSVESKLYEGVPVNEFIFQLRTIPMGVDPMQTNESAPRQVAKR